jgi:sugar diacid utilization regulator
VSALEREESSVVISSAPEELYEKNIEEYVEAVQKTKEYLRSKAELAEEEAVRQRRKKEKEVAELVSTKNQQSSE